MSDLLSAASIFLAAIGLLYSAWYNEITNVLDLEVKKPFEDRGVEIRKAKKVYRNRALPLAVASVVLAIILFPNLMLIVVSSARTFSQVFEAVIYQYNAVNALFCAIAIASICLAWHTGTLAWRTRAKWKKLGGKN